MMSLFEKSFSFWTSLFINFVIRFYRFCFLASSGWNTTPPWKSVITPTVRYSKMIPNISSYKGSKMGEKETSLSNVLNDPLSLWCLAYPEYFGTFRNMTSSCLKKKLTLPFILRYCCLEILFSPKGFFSNLSLNIFLFKPNAKAFKPKYIVLSRVISERCQKISLSRLLSSSQSSFPHRYLTSVRRFPCEKTDQKRIVPLFRSMLFTIRYRIIGPRNEEIISSPCFDTVMLILLGFIMRISHLAEFTLTVDGCVSILMKAKA
jgi:hypothetical protein